MSRLCWTTIQTTWRPTWRTIHYVLHLRKYSRLPFSFNYLLWDHPVLLKQNATQVSKTGNTGTENMLPKNLQKERQIVRTKKTASSSSFIGPILRRNVLPVPASKLHGVTSRRIHFTVTGISQNLTSHITFHTRKKFAKTAHHFAVLILRLSDHMQNIRLSQHPTVSMNCILQVFATPNTCSDWTHIPTN